MPTILIVIQQFALILIPFFCAGFVLNCVSLARKIKKGEEDTARNTIWVIVTLTLIMYSLMSFLVY
ncbi:hypothetical protein BA724_14110 [Domibacillus iocasae]|uniref:Uncharacterized protein n=1 Tax=Domibacillus iocasae TaxID=1714016 RepID=A0A1E7DJV7_9BACI|nr:hypothetical protein BA724_14110 [Domibacillus iocasae]